MRNPLELLKDRLSEMQTEYERVYLISYGTITDNSLSYVKKFSECKDKDLAKIKELITNYKNTIKLLEEFNEC